jgi:hypothetical protein
MIVVMEHRMPNDTGFDCMVGYLALTLSVNLLMNPEGQAKVFSLNKILRIGKVLTM